MQEENFQHVIKNDSSLPCSQWPGVLTAEHMGVDEALLDGIHFHLHFISPLRGCLLAQACFWDPRRLALLFNNEMRGTGYLTTQ